MKKLIKPFAGCLLALTLTGCGPSAQVGADAPVATGMHKASGQVALDDYKVVVQRIYLAYFGRPADPAGLAFHAARFADFNTAYSILDLTLSYPGRADVRQLVDNFGNSTESQELYPGADSTLFITAIYRNLLNREPDAAGLAYWVAAIANGHLTRPQAALSIMAGARGSDVTLIDLKLKAATDFMNGLDTPQRVAAYSGNPANAVVRAMLNAVTLQTDVASLPGMFAPVMATLIESRRSALTAQVGTIILNRCAGCHSVRPTIPGFNPAPRGIFYDTAEQISSDRTRIHRVVTSAYMPYGNMTEMTEAERDTVAQWFVAMGQ